MASALTAKDVQFVTGITVRLAGDSGDGMQLTGSQFTQETAMVGNDLATFPDYPAEIRAPAGTTFGVSAFQIHFGVTDISTVGDELDVLVAMNPAALKVNLGDLRVGGTVIADSGSFTKRNLQNDVSYLSRLWKAIRKKVEVEKAPVEVYQESDLVTRTIRDILTTKISKVICDSEHVTRRIRDFIGIVQPRLKKRVSYYNAKTPLFHSYGIEKEITKIQSSRVQLKSGGSIVIEQTEALVAIDVNSGRYRKQENAEKTALKINIEAAKEIVRQLKLRDLGGLIVCDFIDMRDAKNKRHVEKVFREGLKSDRARSRILRMSSFCLIEITRQRMRPSLQSSTYLKCPHCGGTGVLKTPESQSIEIIRMLNLATTRKDISKIELSVSPEVAAFLQNQNRSDISRLESESDKQIYINSVPDYIGEFCDILCYNERGSKVKF